AQLFEHAPEILALRVRVLIASDGRMQEHATAVDGVEHARQGHADDGLAEARLQVLEPLQEVRADRLVPEVHAGRANPFQIGPGNENTGTGAGVVAGNHETRNRQWLASSLL